MLFMQPALVSCAIIALVLSVSASALVDVTAETEVGTVLVKMPDASADAELPLKGTLFFYELTGLGPDYDPYTGIYALAVPCAHPDINADAVYYEHAKELKEAKGYVEKKSVPLINTALLLNYDAGRYGVFISPDELAVDLIIEKDGSFFYIEGYVPLSAVEKYPEIEDALVGIVLSARFID